MKDLRLFKYCQILIKIQGTNLLEEEINQVKLLKGKKIIFIMEKETSHNFEKIDYRKKY